MKETDYSMEKDFLKEMETPTDWIFYAGSKWFKAVDFLSRYKQHLIQNDVKKGTSYDKLFEIEKRLLTKRIKELEKEVQKQRDCNFELAAYQCDKPYSDEWGNKRCAYQNKIPQWISTRDNLPENKQSVLFYSDQGEKARYIYSGFFFENNFYYESTDEPYALRDSITYWMPSPEIPKQ